MIYKISSNIFYFIFFSKNGIWYNYNQELNNTWVYFLLKITSTTILLEFSQKPFFSNKIYFNMFFFFTGNKTKSRWNQHRRGTYCRKLARARDSHSIGMRNSRTKTRGRRYSTFVFAVERCFPKCQLHTRRNERTQGRNSKSLRRRIFGLRWRRWTRHTLDGKGKINEISYF